MAKYYSKGEFELWQKEQSNYEEMLQVWQANVDMIEDTWPEQEAAGQVAYQVWQEQHDAWENDTSDPPLPEPIKPIVTQDKPVPLPPSEPILNLQIYESRIAEQIEELETPTGTLIVMPGRIILTSNDGTSFSVSEQELNYGYVLKPDD
jgi:hypothetical protein